MLRKGHGGLYKALTKNRDVMDECNENTFISIHTFAFFPQAAAGQDNIVVSITDGNIQNLSSSLPF